MGLYNEGLCLISVNLPQLHIVQFYFFNLEKGFLEIAGLWCVVYIE